MLRLLSLYLFSLFLLFSCGGISILNSDNRDDLYSKVFLQKIESIKKIYNSGNKKGAISRLKLLDDKNLMLPERSMKRNLLGVILFSEKKYEKAIFNFNEALSTSKQDQSLTSQIYLNLSSSYYKMGNNEKSYEMLLSAEAKTLNAPEAKKYHKLRYKLAKELGKDRDSLISLIQVLSFKEKIMDLKSDPYYELLRSEFIKLDRSEKMKILQEVEDDEAMVSGYLGYLEAEKSYYAGDKNESKNILSWVEDHFSKHQEIGDLIKSFSYRMESFAKLDPASVGILLPLSGRSSKLGKRALMGFDSAMRKALNEGHKVNYKIHVMDSKGSGVVGAHRVRELVEKKFVGVIIGGLFAAEAKREYLEARKLGALFISLSQIYLPREQKDHLLIEIPGSVESMMDVLFNEDYLDKFGKRAAIVYPKSDRGKSFVSEFWRRSIQSGVKVTDVLGYEEKSNDYRDPIKKLLGLKYVRERKEEFDLLTEVYALEESSSMRRIQILKPQVDFDWVFIPAYPLEAIQLIPSFTYFDAFKVHIVGGPSWRSKRLSKESYKFKNIHFIGDNASRASKKFSQWFKKEYEQRGSLIEMMAFDSFQIVHSILNNPSFKTRDELAIKIKNENNLSGLTGRWTFKEGLWSKEMLSLHLRNGRIKKSERSISSLPFEEIEKAPQSEESD